MSRKFRHADIIITRARGMADFTHTGLVVDEAGQLKVVHNSPDNINRWGGNITVENIEDYLEGRPLISTHPSGLSDAEIQAGIEACKHKKFSLMGFNCEHFMSFITQGKPVSPQLTQFMRLLGVGVAGPLLVYFGIRSRHPLLWLAGIGLILYNGYQYVSTDLETSTGLGDSVKNLIDNATLGKISKPCDACDKRQQWLNAKMPYKMYVRPFPKEVIDRLTQPDSN